jgi:hypothetical protein
MCFHYLINYNLICHMMMNMHEMLMIMLLDVYACLTPRGVTSTTAATTTTVGGGDGPPNPPLGDVGSGDASPPRGSSQ